MSTTDVVLGVDIGTSDTKVLATTLDGREIAWVAAPTRWNTRAGSRTETDPDQLYTAVLDLAEQAVAAAQRLTGPVRVLGIATTGLAEAGVLLDHHRCPVYPIIAWFDPRGSQEFEQLDATVLEEFRGRTGLPLSPLASIAKLAWMRGQGTNLAGHTWLSVPEYVAIPAHRYPRRRVFPCRPDRLARSGHIGGMAGRGAGPGRRQSDPAATCRCRNPARSGRPADRDGARGPARCCGDRGRP